MGKVANAAAIDERPGDGEERLAAEIRRRCEMLDEIMALDALPLKPGYIVELRSGSFPMTIVHICEEHSSALCLWDVNGPYSGKACRPTRMSVPLCALKIWKRPDEQDIPF